MRFARKAPSLASGGGAFRLIVTPAYQGGLFSHLKCRRDKREHCLIPPNYVNQSLTIKTNDSGLYLGAPPMDFDHDSGDFGRLHNLFTFHLGIAVTLSWLTSLYAAVYAPWVRNIRPLIDPTNVGTVESTWSYLFIFPIVLTTAWLISIFGQKIFAKFRILKSQAIEFGIAAAVAFVMFYLSIDRAVAAMLLGM